MEHILSNNVEFCKTMSIFRASAYDVNEDLHADQGLGEGKTGKCV